MVVVSIPVTVTYTSDFVSASSKEFLDIEAIMKCEFTLNRVSDIYKIYTQVSIFLAVWLKGGVFVFELIGCVFEPTSYSNSYVS